MRIFSASFLVLAATAFKLLLAGFDMVLMTNSSAFHSPLFIAGARQALACLPSVDDSVHLPDCVDPAHFDLARAAVYARYLPRSPQARELADRLASVELRLELSRAAPADPSPIVLNLLSGLRRTTARVRLSAWVCRRCLKSLGPVEQ
jgi:hypothetical protein